MVLVVLRGRWRWLVTVLDPLNMDRWGLLGGRCSRSVGGARADGNGLLDDLGLHDNCIVTLVMVVGVLVGRSSEGAEGEEDGVSGSGMHSERIGFLAKSNWLCLAWNI